MAEMDRDRYWKPGVEEGEWWGDWWHICVDDRRFMGV